MSRAVSEGGGGGGGTNNNNKKTLRIIVAWMSSQCNMIGLREKRVWDGPGLFVDAFC